MLTGKDLRNKWIVSVSNGQKVAEIKDVYLDAEATKVVAVLTGKEGLLKPKMVGTAPSAPLPTLRLII